MGHVVQRPNNTDFTSWNRAERKIVRRLGYSKAGLTSEISDAQRRVHGRGGKTGEPGLSRAVFSLLVRITETCVRKLVVWVQRDRRDRRWRQLGATGFATRQRTVVLRHQGLCKCNLRWGGWGGACGIEDSMPEPCRCDGGRWNEWSSTSKAL